MGDLAFLQLDQPTDDIEKRKRQRQKKAREERRRERRIEMEENKRQGRCKFKSSCVRLALLCVSLCGSCRSQAACLCSAICFLRLFHGRELECCSKCWGSCLS